MTQNVAYVVELLKLSFRTTKQNKLEKHINIKHVHEPLQPPACAQLEHGRYRHEFLTIGTIVSKILHLTSETN